MGQRSLNEMGTKLKIIIQLMNYMDGMLAQPWHLGILLYQVNVVFDASQAACL